MREVRYDDSCCKAWERFERIEMRVPRALGQAPDPIRKITRIAVVTQPLPAQTSAPVPGEAEADVWEKNCDQHTPKGRRHHRFVTTVAGHANSILRHRAGL